MSGAVAVFSGCYAGTGGELASESATARRVQAVSPTVRLVTGAFQAWRVCRQRTPPLATKERPSRTAIVRSAMEPIFDGLVGKSHVALAMRRSRNESILLGRLAPQPRCYGAGVRSVSGLGPAPPYTMEPAGRYRLCPPGSATGREESARTGPPNQRSDFPPTWRCSFHRTGRGCRSPQGDEPPALQFGCSFAVPSRRNWG